MIQEAKCQKIPIKMKKVKAAWNHALYCILSSSVARVRVAPHSG